MLKRSSLAIVMALAVIVFAAPAFAGSCPKVIAGVQGEMKEAKGKVSAAVMEKAMNMLMEAQVHHKMGMHDMSIMTAKKAEKLLDH